MDKGYIHIYTGDGKGKTTAALGLALRAAGHGFDIFIGQFMKGQYYGELTSLQRIPNITIEQFGDEGCITKEEVTDVHKSQAKRGLDRISKIMAKNKYDIIIMDEICVALWFGLITEEEVIKLMQYKPDNIELILTGRKATKKLIATADIVTQMQEIRHYYNSMGVMSRKGIEN